MGSGVFQTDTSHSLVSCCKYSSCSVTCPAFQFLPASSDVWLWLVQVREGLHYNPYFPGGAIAMPKMLVDEGTEYDDDSVFATESQQAKVGSQGTHLRPPFCEEASSVLQNAN